MGSGAIFNARRQAAAIADAPAFKLTSNGEVVSKDSLKGKVWVGSCLFTTALMSAPGRCSGSKASRAGAERRPEHREGPDDRFADHRGDTLERAEANPARRA